CRISCRCSTSSAASMTRAADPTPGARRSSRLADTLLIVFSVVVSIVVAEGVVRYLNGQPLFAFPLPEVADPAPVDMKQRDQTPVAEGVDRKWFYTDPTPLPNRGESPPGWTKLFDYHWAHPLIHSEFQPIDIFKVWNSAFVGDPCTHRFLRDSPGKLYVY